MPDAPSQVTSSLTSNSTSYTSSFGPSTSALSRMNREERNAGVPLLSAREDDEGEYYAPPHSNSDQHAPPTPPKDHVVNSLSARLSQHQSLSLASSSSFSTSQSQSAAHVRAQSERTPTTGLSAPVLSLSVSDSGTINMDMNTLGSSSNMASMRTINLHDDDNALGHGMPTSSSSVSASAKFNEHDKRAQGGGDQTPQGTSGLSLSGRSGGGGLGDAPMNRGLSLFSPSATSASIRTATNSGNSATSSSHPYPPPPLPSSSSSPTFPQTAQSAAVGLGLGPLGMSSESSTSGPAHPAQQGPTTTNTSTNFSPTPGSGLTPVLSQTGQSPSQQPHTPQNIAQPRPQHVQPRPRLASEGSGSTRGELVGLGIGVAGAGGQRSPLGMGSGFPSGSSPSAGGGSLGERTAAAAMNSTGVGLRDPAFLAHHPHHQHQHHHQGLPTRGNMILYRLSSPPLLGSPGLVGEDGVLLPPGGLNRGSMYSHSGDSIVSLAMGGDSKYPLMTMGSVTRPGTPVTLGSTSHSLGGNSGMTPLLGTSGTMSSFGGAWGPAAGGTPRGSGIGNVSLSGLGLGYAGTQSEFGSLNMGGAAGGTPGTPGTPSSLNGNGNTSGFVGTQRSHGGLVAYAYDPEEDEDADELDAEEEEWVKGVRGKLVGTVHPASSTSSKGKERERQDAPASLPTSASTKGKLIAHRTETSTTLSTRGLVNIAALIVLVAGILSLFVVYPITEAFKNDIVEQSILGNTRINSTGQATFETTPAGDTLVGSTDVKKSVKAPNRGGVYDMPTSRRRRSVTLVWEGLEGLVERERD
ncbi:hypothetical protein CPC08DRAFT_763649 [Agrocybe pediades]|nr:hypothetical protein CPC08DRAFT_763649 [Agrocybe pediades]